MREFLREAVTQLHEIASIDKTTMQLAEDLEVRLFLSHDDAGLPNRKRKTHFAKDMRISTRDDRHYEIGFANLRFHARDDFVDR
jgi:hypothetical protein